MLTKYPDDYSHLQPTDKLPESFFPENGEAVPFGIIGSKIVRFGGGPRGANLEGGGLIIDYLPHNSDCLMRVVLEFMERGMWVSYVGPVCKPPTSAEH